MSIGIVGNGTVGGALAHAFSSNRPKVWDVDGQRCVHDLVDVVGCDVVLVCIPEKFVPVFFSRGEVQDSRETTYVIKSTVPIGTTRGIYSHGFKNVVHSPEFLTARTAREDAANPRVNIIGAVNPGEQGPHDLWRLYYQRWPEVPIHKLSSDQSEAVKLMMNSFFAVKVAFFNEMRCLCDALKMEWEPVRQAIVAEGRVSDLHTHVPGPDGQRGFGGTCLPKDLAQLIGIYHAALGPNAAMMAAAQIRNLKDRNRTE